MLPGVARFIHTGARRRKFIGRRSRELHIFVLHVTNCFYWAFFLFTFIYNIRVYCVYRRGGGFDELRNYLTGCQSCSILSSLRIRYIFFGMKILSVYIFTNNYWANYVLFQCVVSYEGLWLYLFVIPRCICSVIFRCTPLRIRLITHAVYRRFFFIHGIYKRAIFRDRCRR